MVYNTVREVWFIRIQVDTADGRGWLVVPVVHIADMNHERRLPITANEFDQA
jgi:hypothetical protein